MKKITKKYIFECKLKGVAVQVDTDVLYHKGILDLLVITGIWEKDWIGSNKAWNEHSFKVLYPIQLREPKDKYDGHKWMLLTEGCHHLVCL